MTTLKQQAVTVLLPIIAAAILVPLFVHAADCKAWWRQCQGQTCANYPPSCTTSNKIQATCERDACKGTAASSPGGDMKGLTDAMKFMAQALGLINGLKGLMAPPTAPTPPTSYYPPVGGGCVNSFDRTPYLQAQVLNYYGCCGSVDPRVQQASDSVVRGSVTGSATLMPICELSANLTAACPSVRMLCCDGQWRLATSPNAVCPAPVDGTFGTNPSLDTLNNAFDDGAKTSVLAAPDQPTPNFLEAIARGFGDITKTISEVTGGAGTTVALPASGKVVTVTKDHTEVRETDTGATLEVDFDTEGKSGIVGFYGVSGGAGGVGSQASSIIGRLCASRPWATGLISRLIAPSFLDGVCARFGYTVGARKKEEVGGPTDTLLASRAAIARMKSAQNGNAAPKKKELGISCTPDVIREGESVALDWSCGTSTVTGTNGFQITEGVKKLVVSPKVDTTYGVRCKNNFIDACRVRVVHPQLAIWSEPPSARLGSRTVIKWNSRDVFENSCTIDGPSFHETGARGGASTASINDSSIFSISCLAMDGATTTTSVTVELAL